MGKVVSESVLNKITEIICRDIGSAILDGATYILITDKPNMKYKIEKYISVRRDLDAEGFSSDEVFRVYKVSNGYVFDIDMNTAKTITASLAQIMGQSNDNIKTIRELIDKEPLERVKKDKELLAKRIIKGFKNGERTIDVALFSRNKSNKILVMADDKDGNQGAISFSSYALRLNDLTDLNTEFLIENGVRIASVDYHEILGSNSGLRTTLHVGERIKKNL